jgi:hypothetical protein
MYNGGFFYLKTMLPKYFRIFPTFNKLIIETPFLVPKIINDKVFCLGTFISLKGIVINYSCGVVSY